jgi:hypothetical protein
VSGFVADDGAVALQEADGEDFVDHGLHCTKHYHRGHRRYTGDSSRKVLPVFLGSPVVVTDATLRCGTCRAGGIGETIRARASEDCSGEISAAWVSGSGSGAAG